MNEQQIKAKFGKPPEETTTPTIVPPEIEQPPETTPEQTDKQAETTPEQTSKITETEKEKITLNLIDLYDNGIGGITAGELVPYLIEKGFSKTEATETAENIKHPERQAIKKELFQFMTQPHKEQCQINLARAINNIYNLFAVDHQTGNKTTRKYYLVTKTGSYKEVKRAWLQTEINKYTTKKVLARPIDFDNVLCRTPNIRNFNDDYIELKNCLVNMRTLSILDKTKTSIVTTDQLGITKTNPDGTPEKQLFTYYKDLTTENLAPENEGDTIQVLKQILIPKDKPEKTEVYKFFIQLVGLMVTGSNKAKRLVLFYGNGDNGKSMLLLILRVLFDKTYCNIKGKNIDDQFFISTLAIAKHCLASDEIKYEDTNKYKENFKILCGGQGDEGRGMYVEEQKRVENIPPSILCANYIPEIPNEEAYIRKWIITELPNQFVGLSEIDVNKNQYPIFSNIDDKIKNDVIGMSQLISMAINEVKQMDLTGNIREQLALNPTIHDTIYLLNKNNTLRGFIQTYTEEGATSTIKGQWTSVEEIKTQFIDYYKRTNENATPPEVFIKPENIGATVKEVYPNIHKTRVNGTRYDLRLRSFEEVEEEQTLYIKTYELDNLEYGLTLSKYETAKKVFDVLDDKNNSIQTEKAIIKEFGTYPVEEVVNALKYLDKEGFIEYTTQQTI